MKEVYRLGTDEYCLECMRGFDPPIPGLSRKLWVKYSITPSEYRSCSWLRDALFVIGSADAGAYLPLKSIGGQPFPVDIEFCEKVLSHLAERPQDIPNREDCRKWSGVCPSGRVNVRGFQDITHENMVWARSRGAV